jgi:ABC-type nitrate/sulfonate/bicarbonate transport system permease component
MAVIARPAEQISGYLGRRRKSRLRRAYDQVEDFLLGSLAVIAFLLLWEWAGNSVPNGRLFFSSPSAIWSVAATEVTQPAIWNHLRVSGIELVIGFVMAAGLGIALGVVVGWYRRVNAIFSPFLNVLYATPRIALTPLFIIWFGIGMNSKIALVFLGALFPIWLNTQSGVRNLDMALVKAARSFGSNDWQLFRTVALPGSVPFIISGLKLGVGRALIGVIVGELVAAQAGIGFYMAQAGATFQTGRLFFGVMIVAVTGLISFWLIGLLEKRFQAWRPQFGRAGEA